MTLTNRFLGFLLSKLLKQVQCVSIENYSPADVLHFTAELNSRPRKRLGYQTPEELFDAFIDNLYAA